MHCFTGSVATVHGMMLCCEAGSVATVHGMMLCCEAVLKRRILSCMLKLVQPQKIVLRTSFGSQNRSLELNLAVKTGPPQKTGPRD